MRLLVGKIADARGERANVVVTVEGGRITGLAERSPSTRPEPGDIEAADGLLLPGFLDIHIHGGAGRYVMEETPEALTAVATHLARFGVTGFLPTTITAPWKEKALTLRFVQEAMHSPENGKTGAAILGCHLEGPYINPKKKGAQPEQHIRLPDIAELQRETGDYLAAAKVMTLAPEMPGALEMIRFLVTQGIIASLGHTDATYAQVCAGIDAGARHATHTFNAMRPMESREPGTVGGVFSRPELMAELIWDNHHVHPASCQALIAAKTAERTLFISDGIPGTGMPDGYQFDLGGLPILVRDGTARLPDGTLAGSLLTLDQAFRNAAAFPLAARARMTSYNAALTLGLAHRKGLLAPGYDADLVLLDANHKVRQTFVAGRTVYS